MNKQEKKYITLEWKHGDDSKTITVHHSRVNAFDAFNAIGVLLQNVVEEARERKLDLSEVKMIAIQSCAQQIDKAFGGDASHPINELVMSAVGRA